MLCCYREYSKRYIDNSGCNNYNRCHKCPRSIGGYCHYCYNDCIQITHKVITAEIRGHNTITKRNGTGNMRMSRKNLPIL